MTFDFHPEAKSEFYEATHWYEDRSIYAGDRFMAALRLAINAILKDPTSYQLVSEGIHVFRLKKYPFKLYYPYETLSELVRIYAVMHEKRQPDYWRARLEVR